MPVQNITHRFLTRAIPIGLIIALLLGTFALQPARADVSETFSEHRTVPKSAVGESQTIQPGHLPEGLTSTQWDSIQDIITADQYAFEQADDLAAATNHTQNWNLTFSQYGLRVTPRNQDQSWQWGLTLNGYGYASNGDFGNFGNSRSPLDSLTTDANTLTYQWDENISEWWINDPAGLEQGFSINERPPISGTENQTPLIVEMGVTGTLTPAYTPAGNGIIFQNADGETILTYDKLHVTDAAGKVVPARFSLSRGERAGMRANSPFIIQIHVEDAHAVYPLTIDPWVQIAKLTASDGAAGDKFGQSVAIDGDTLVVGASGGKGSAYVFIKPSVGGWATTSSYVAKLTASDGAAGDDFGFSVAIDSDIIVVGAYQDDNGSAYVFDKPGGGWNDNTETAKLTAEGGQSVNFGYSVAISGDTVVVGANWAGSGPSFGQGAAYVFVEPGGGWATTSTYDAKLTASDAVDGEEEHLGISVAISGDTVVVGADHDDIGSKTRQGSAYVFVKPAGGWNDMTETAKLTTSAEAFWDLMFGTSVAISGDTIVVGAPGYSASRGSAYIYNKPGGGWATTDTYTARLTAAGGTGPDEFGESVAINGDKIVVGAYQDDS